MLMDQLKKSKMQVKKAFHYNLHALVKVPFPFQLSIFDTKIFFCFYFQEQKATLENESLRKQVRSCTVPIIFLSVNLHD